MCNGFQHVWLEVASGRIKGTENKNPHTEEASVIQVTALCQGRQDFKYSCLSSLALCDHFSSPAPSALVCLLMSHSSCWAASSSCGRCSYLTNDQRSCVYSNDGSSDCDPDQIGACVILACRLCSGLYGWFTWVVCTSVHLHAKT